METKTYTILVTVTGETLPTEEELTAHIAQSDPAGAAWSIAEADAFDGQRLRAECDHAAELVINRHRERCERDKPPEPPAPESAKKRRLMGGAHNVRPAGGGGSGPIKPNAQ